MKKIITTVGTSLFSNYMNDQVKNYYGRNYAFIDDPFEKTKDANATDIYLDDFLPYIKSIQEKIEDYWFKYPDDVPNRLASAEIASILKIVEEEPDETFEVHFIATDTLQSVLAAEMITDWLEKYKAINNQIKTVLFQRSPTGFDNQKLSEYVVKDLQVSRQDDYEKGVLNLLNLLNRITKKDTSLNITGGYKAIVPIVTIWAQIKKVSIRYLFNESELKQHGEALTLGYLPINFDWAEVERFHYYLNNETLKLGDLSDEIKNELLKRRLILKDNKGICKVTSIGSLFRDARDNMPDGGGTFGKFVELKLWEHFVKNPISGFGTKMPIRGSTCFRHDETGEMVKTVPEKDQGTNKFSRIEIDLTFQGETGTYAILESKSISGIGYVKPYLYMEGAKFFNQGQLPDLFILVIYKYEHEKLSSRKQQIMDLKRVVIETHKVPDFRVYYFNLPLSKDHVRVNYQSFVDQQDLFLIDAIDELKI